MIDLYIYGQRANSIFEILGTKENDISFAIGLGFSKVPGFLNKFLQLININSKFNPELAKIKLQQYEVEKGFTDFEIEQEGEFSIIIEAKKGWNYPTQNQLDKYSSKPSFNSFSAKQKKLIVFTESSKDYTSAHFYIRYSNGYEVIVVSYKELWTIANATKSECNNFEKRFLQELIYYFEKIMTMQNINSNLVFVVSLSYRKVKDWNISWIDIVEQRKRYFHQIGGNGWPTEPPNYIAFRYYGKLQSIHHIDNYEVFTDPNNIFNEIPSVNWGHHYLYHLSDPLIPAKEIKTGNIFRNGRVWAMLDLLLTCDTIAEARDKTKERERGD